MLLKSYHGGVLLYIVSPCRRTSLSHRRYLLLLYLHYLWINSYSLKFYNAQKRGLLQSPRDYGIVCVFIVSHFLQSNQNEKFTYNSNLYDKISSAAGVDFYRGPEEYLVSINSKDEQDRRLISQRKIGLNIKYKRIFRLASWDLSLLRQIFLL